MISMTSDRATSVLGSAPVAVREEQVPQYAPQSGAAAGADHLAVGEVSVRNPSHGEQHGEMAVESNVRSEKDMLSTGSTQDDSTASHVVYSDEGSSVLHGETPAERATQRKISKEDFQLLKVIGMGAFGKVLQVRSRRNGQILAMKCISKKMLERRNHIAYMQAERDIMTKVSHPFVVALQCAFQTDSKLFLVMEYLPGGELFFHLSKKGLFSEEYARFYAAEMVLALEHLHSKGIIHRDLKPENLLLGASGHICVTDFGLAKELSDAEYEGLKTICGTNEYMAPEMILRKGYGKAVDWWSMGALVYEMTSGYPPFQGKTPKEINRKILNERVSLPKWLSSTTHQVLRGFLERNVSRRLGAKKTTMFDIGGATAVKHHPFFEGIDWAKLIALQIEPPLKPELDSTTDTSNFCLDFVRMALPRSLSEDSVVSNSGSLAPKIGGSMPGMYRGFSFVADSFVDDEEWRLSQQEQGSSQADGTEQHWNDSAVKGEPDGNAVSALLARPKKMKGKRIRNKKGKGKVPLSSDVVERKPPVDTATKEHGENEPPPTTVRDNSHTDSSWGTSGHVLPTPHGNRRALPAESLVRSKPSALAAMLAEQNDEHARTTSSLSSTPRRANVWGARDLPAPAPVPTPAVPPRAPARYRGERGVPGKKPPAKDATDLPGRRLPGNTFAWKRPA